MVCRGQGCDFPVRSNQRNETKSDKGPSGADVELVSDRLTEEGGRASRGVFLSAAEVEFDFPFIY